MPRIAAVFIIAFSLAFSGGANASTELSQALAKFIEAVYDNTESGNGGSKICLFGSDNISLHMDSAKTFALNEDGLNKQEYKNCRIIYVAKDKEKLVKSFIDDLNASGALTLAVFSNFVNDGGMLIIEVGRRNFEMTVNVAEFKKSGVKLDSAIIGLIVSKK